MVESITQNDQQASYGIGGLLTGQLKYQYFGGVWSLPTYWQMRGGTVSVEPLYMANLFYSGFHKLGASMGSSAPWYKKALGILTGANRFSVEESVSAFVAKSGVSTTAKDALVSSMTADLKRYMLKHKWENLRNGQVVSAIKSIAMNSTPKTGTVIWDMSTKKMTSEITRLGMSMRTAMAVSRMGSLMMPAMTGITIGQVLANTAAFAFKGAMAATDYVRTRTESWGALEMGRGLSSGYQSGAAATERQRAMQEMARTPINARRVLGSEASIYAGLC